MVEALLFSVPALVYVVVQSRGKNRTMRAALRRIGATWGNASSYRLALLLLAPLLLLSWLSLVLIPPDIRTMPGVTVAQVTSIGAVIAVALRALGEEIVFRGLLGGIFVRRCGFLWGNLLQATIFLLPHLALVLVSPTLWVILPVQFMAGWLMGWLRYKADSLVPGALVHAVVNIAAGLMVA